MLNSIALRERMKPIFTNWKINVDLILSYIPLIRIIFLLFYYDFHFLHRDELRTGEVYISELLVRLSEFKLILTNVIPPTKTPPDII